MKTNEIYKIIVESVIKNMQNNDMATMVNGQTALIGRNRVVDSLGLVNILVDVETTLLDEGINVSLTSDRAMSSRISPFRSVNSLNNFIISQLKAPSNE